MSWQKHPVASSRAKRRMIDPSWWQNFDIPKLTWFERYMLVGLVSNADDQGRMHAHPAILRNKLFFLDNVTIEEAEAGLAAIEKAGFIVTYEGDDGQLYLQLTLWWTDSPMWQKPQWAYPSECPPPPGWSDRLRYRFGNQVVTSNWGDDDPGGFDDDADDPTPATPPPSSLGKASANGTGKALPIATESESESGLESESEFDGVDSGAAAFKRIVAEWEANFGLISREHGSYFDDWLIDYPAGEIVDAIASAGRTNRKQRVRTPLRYVDSILKKAGALHPAVRGWLDETRRPRPGPTLEQQIIATVGDAETDLTFWRQVLVAYAGMGWNREAITNQLEFFKRRELPGQGANYEHNKRTTGQIPALARGGHTKRVADPKTGEEYWIDVRTRERVAGPA